MFTTTLTFNGKAAQEIRERHMPPAVMVTVNIDANTARRDATVWLVSEVGNMLKAGTGQLVITNQAVWRMPALLTSSKIGTVGQVGTVDVDAVTGKLLVNDQLRVQILHNAKHLVRLTHPSIG
ncbi:MAG: hypothetical protein ACPGWR_22530 [Ardenticatenaceae bacterium]